MHNLLQVGGQFNHRTIYLRGIRVYLEVPRVLALARRLYGIAGLWFDVDDASITLVVHGTVSASCLPVIALCK